jgi:phasin family protein
MGVPALHPFATFYKPTLDAIVASETALLDGLEKLAHLNLSVLRAGLEEGTQAVSQASQIREAADAQALATALGQPSIDKVIAYGKHVQALSATVQQALTQAAQDYASQSAQQLRAGLTQATQATQASLPGTANAFAGFAFPNTASGTTLFDAWLQAAQTLQNTAQTQFQSLTRNLHAATGNPASQA